MPHIRTAGKVTPVTIFFGIAIIILELAIGTSWPFGTEFSGLAQAAGKVTICHATGSASNPYNQLVVNDTAINGHFENNGTPKNGHPGDLLFQGEVDCPASVVTQDQCNQLFIYEKTGDFNDSRININFESSDNQIDVSAGPGYVVVEVALDVENDGFSGFHVYATGPINNFNPTPGNNIEAARVRVQKLCPSPTPTPSPSPSASPTPTPSATPSPTPTLVSSPTPSPSPSPTPTLSISPTPTPSPSPTPTPSPSPSASPTPTPSATPSPTPTPSISPTPTPSATPSNSPSPTPTVITTPTPSPTGTGGSVGDGDQGPGGDCCAQDDDNNQVATTKKVATSSTGGGTVLGATTTAPQAPVQRVPATGASLLVNLMLAGFCAAGSAAGLNRR